MQRILLLLLLLTGLRGNAQQVGCLQVYNTVDVAASYQYGNTSLLNFTSSELAPLVVACTGPDFEKVGSIYLNLTIDSAGRVTDVNVAQGKMSEACKTRLRSRVMAMQGWKPAQVQGRAVCSRYRWAVGSLGASVQGLSTLQGVDTLPRMRMTTVQEKPKPIDSNITIAPFDLSRYAVAVPLAQKKKLVTKVIREAFGESSLLFLKNPCLMIDSATGKEKKSKQKAPDCRLDDFYFLDLDKDGDLDIVYNSVTDQLLNWGTNRLFIFRNEGAHYLTSSAEGYLYSADFSQWEAGALVLKTVQYPDNMINAFQFSEYRFFTRSWGMSKTASYERRAGLVHAR